MTGPLEGLRSSYDAVVVGARCAGAATAMLLARAGASVLLVDRSGRGADTLSTLALMRGGVLQLSRWGLLNAIVAAGTPPIRKTTFDYGGDAVAIEIKPRDGVDALYAPRRTLLDVLLADAARIAGADVVHHVRLKDLERDTGGRVTGAIVENAGRERSISSAIVIGADGLKSTVAARVDAKPYRMGWHESGVIYTFVSSRAFEGYQWHYRPGASVGVIPTNSDRTLVFAAAPRERFMGELRTDLAAGLTTIVREVAPAVADEIAGAATDTFRGFAGHPGFVRPAWGPGWALVGDAGYFKDPITAHGITDALRDAEMLARAVLIGTDSALADYQATRDDLSLPLFDISDEIASYAWDFARLQTLHRLLSHEMNREVAHIVDSTPHMANV